MSLLRRDLMNLTPLGVSRSFVTTTVAGVADIEYYRYIDGLNANGPASMMMCVNEPLRNQLGSGTQVYGSEASGSEIIRAFRLVIPRPITINQVFVNVTVAATSTFRVGIWDTISTTTGDILPNTILKDSGDAATNPAALRPATLNYRIATPGLYWIGVAFKTSAGSTVSVHGGLQSCNIGVTAALLPVQCIKRTFTYGALPNWGTTFTAETGGAISTWMNFSSVG